MRIRELGTRLLPHRLLLVILAFALLVGMWEFRISRDRGPVEWLTEEGQRVMEVITSVNPTDPDSDFFAAMRALFQGDEAEFARLLEKAVETGAKHNELMERFHVQYLLSTSTDFERINQALTGWRRNHPFAQGNLTVDLGSPPTTVQQVQILERRLEEIGWVESAKVEGWEEGDMVHWRILLGFRRGRTIDVGDALAVAYAVVPSESGHGLGLETGAAELGRSPGSGWHPW